MNKKINADLSPEIKITNDVIKSIENIIKFLYLVLEKKNKFNPRTKGNSLDR